MSIQVTDEQGIIHDFPDGTTESQMMDAIKQSAPKPPSLLQRADNVSKMINSAIDYPIQKGKEFYEGAAQGVANIPASVYNLGATGVNSLGGNLPKAPLINLAPDTLASKAGDAASFFVPGGALNELSRIPQIARTLGSALDLMKANPITSKAIGGSILGGAMSPNNPLLGMAAGGAAAPISKGIELGYQGTKNVLSQLPSFQKFMPERLANAITDRLGVGSKTLDENAKSLSNDIREAHDSRADTASALYNYPKQIAGNEEIYEKQNPLITTAMDKAKDITDKLDDLKIGDLYDSFKKKPTFINAHNLQSELGVMVRDLDSKPYKTIAESNEIKKISDIRDQLKDDIQSFLEKRDLNSNEMLAPIYQKASNYYQDEVTPFLANKKLRDINRGRQTTVDNTHDIFKNPKDTINSDTGLVEKGFANKILDTLPDESRNKILYGAIGGHINQRNANALLKNIGRAANKGYSSMITPELDTDINALNERIKNLGLASKIGSGAAIAGGLAGAGALAGGISNALNKIV